MFFIIATISFMIAHKCILLTFCRILNIQYCSLYFALQFVFFQFQNISKLCQFLAVYHKIVLSFNPQSKVVVSLQCKQEFHIISLGAFKCDCKPHSIIVNNFSSFCFPWEKTNSNFCRLASTLWDFQEIYYSNLDTNNKNFRKPVGSTVCYKVMKLCSGSV